MFRIEVQDILIIFQHFSSQDILIKDRTFINFERFQEIKWFHREKWSEKVNKMQKMVKNMSIPTKISSQDIYSGQDVYYFGINFPPGLLFRTGRLLGTLEYVHSFLFLSKSVLLFCFFHWVKTNLKSLSASSLQGKLKNNDYTSWQRFEKLFSVTCI